MIKQAFSQTMNHTDTQAQNHVSNPLGMFVPLILIFVVFYFLLIRPQQKRQKQHQERLAQIKRGTKIVTGGGLIGEVHRVINEHEVEIDLADSVRVKVVKSTIARIIDVESDSSSSVESKKTIDTKSTKKQNSA